MTLAFVKVVPRGSVGPETVLNVYWYYYVLGGLFVTAAEMAQAATSWAAALKTPLLNVMPTEFSLVDITVSGYESDGFPTTLTPHIRIESGTGAVTDPTTGRHITATVAAALGAGTKLVTAAKFAKRGHWAVGPITENAVDEDNKFVASAYAGSNWATHQAGFGTALQVGGVDTYFPMKPSFTFNHLRDPRIQTYRAIDAVFTRPYASVRRSRMNRK